MPIERFDDGAAQGFVAGILFGVGMMTNAPVIHVEIGVYKTRFQAGAKVIFRGQFFVKPRWISGFQHLVKLADRDFHKIQFAGNEGIPARGVFGYEFDFNPVSEWRTAAFEPLHPVLGLCFRVIAFSSQTERLLPEADVSDQHSAGCIKSLQAERAGTNWVDCKFPSMKLDRFPGHHG